MSHQPAWVVHQGVPHKQKHNVHKENRIKESKAGNPAQQINVRYINKMGDQYLN